MSCQRSASKPWCWKGFPWVCGECSLQSHAWRKRCERVDACQNQTRNVYLGGYHVDGRSFIAPSPCHDRFHGCRKTDIGHGCESLADEGSGPDRSGESLPKMVTLTRAYRLQKPRVIDWYWLSTGPMLRKFMDRWRKALGKAPRYVAVLEPHLSGMPHFHVLVNHAQVDERLLSSWWRSVGGSWNVKMTDATMDPTYPAKHVGKWCGLSQRTKAVLFTNRIRLVRRSNGLRRKKDEGWMYTLSDAVGAEAFVEDRRAEMQE